MWRYLSEGFNTLQAALFESVVVPLLRALDLMAFSEPAFDGVEIFLLGAIEIALLYAVLRPLELWRPAEKRPEIEAISIDRRTDVAYTLLHRLGGFALISFALLTPILDFFESSLRLQGLVRLQLDALPLLSANVLLLFAAYFVILDFADYWVHRAQHRLNFWWQLHALHHANEHMTLWSDNRNHLLDDMARDVLMAVLAWLIGVGPEQYVVWIAISRGLQSMQHANLILPFGHIGERLLVSPYFHRTHHAISSGYEGRAFGCNFGVVFPWWDILFGTAKYGAAPEPTGVRDAQQGREYGVGFWAQQKLGILRLLGRA